ncbi:MAG TPA: hypothetical protein VGD99_17730, partial [Anaerolineae bacterium]
LSKILKFDPAQVISNTSCATLLENTVGTCHSGRPKEAKNLHEVQSGLDINVLKEILRSSE